MRLTVDIIGDFIKGLKIEGDILAASIVDGHTDILVSNTYHLRKGMPVLIDDVGYKITDVQQDSVITVLGEIDKPKKYRAPSLVYFHGTPVMTNNHIAEATEAQKTPMVYLYEILREKFHGPNSGLDRTSSIRLFFLDSANFEDWETEDHYTNRLYGLNSLVEFFREQAVKYECKFHLFDVSFDVINHTRFGVFTSMKGHEKRIFDEDLTGVELSFELPIKKCLNCK